MNLSSVRIENVTQVPYGPHCTCSTEARGTTARVHPIPFHSLQKPQGCHGYLMVLLPKLQEMSKAWNVQAWVCTVDITRQCLCIGVHTALSRSLQLGDFPHFSMYTGSEVTSPETQPLGPLAVQLCLLYLKNCCLHMVQFWACVAKVKGGMSTFSQRVMSVRDQDRYGLFMHSTL